MRSRAPFTVAAACSSSRSAPSHSGHGIVWTIGSTCAGDSTAIGRPGPPPSASRASRSRSRTSPSCTRARARRSARAEGLRLATVAWRLGTFPRAVPDPIIQEELNLLAEVNTRLDAAAPEHAPSETALVQELEHLREALRDGSTKEEDRAALMQQWDRHSALLKQLRTAERAPAVDATSPYFAHLKLRESRSTHDILIGKTTRLLPDYPIVDWRNAPISRVFYRYRQGEEYEEEIAGRVKEGVVLARRTVSIRDRQLRRVDAPEGIFQLEDGGHDGWKQIARETPRLAGGQGAALR